MELMEYNDHDLFADSPFMYIIRPLVLMHDYDLPMP